MFGRPQKLAELLEASGYDIPASETEAGLELYLRCLVKVRATTDTRPSKSSCWKLPNDCLPHSLLRVRDVSFSDSDSSQKLDLKA